jgi:hypothetical protein
MRCFKISANLPGRKVTGIKNKIAENLATVYFFGFIIYWPTSREDKREAKNECKQDRETKKEKI